MFLLVKPIIQAVLSISSIQHREKNGYFTDFLLQGVSVETFNQCGGRKKTSFAKKQMWSKTKIWRMLQWNSQLSIIQGLRRLVKTDSVCICFVSKHHYSALLQFECWFSFSLFYILLFSAHIVNINAAKSSTVLDKQSLNIFMYFFKVQVVI